MQNTNNQYLKNTGLLILSTRHPSKSRCEFLQIKTKFTHSVRKSVLIFSPLIYLYHIF
jgi:hypothetical protein